jgi:hypothetical protein
MQLPVLGENDQWSLSYLQVLVPVLCALDFNILTISLVLELLCLLLHSQVLVLPTAVPTNKQCCGSGMSIQIPDLELEPKF